MPILTALLLSVASQTPNSAPTTVVVADEGRPAADAIAKALPGYSASSVSDPSDARRRTVEVYDPHGVGAASISVVDGRIVSVRTRDGTFPRPRDMGQLLGWIANGNSSVQY